MRFNGTSERARGRRRGERTTDSPSLVGVRGRGSGRGDSEEEKSVSEAGNHSQTHTQHEQTSVQFCTDADRTVQRTSDARRTNCRLSCVACLLFSRFILRCACRSLIALQSSVPHPVPCRPSSICLFLSCAKRLQADAVITAAYLANG